MDEGWAVILGATIALAGSSLIPWLRESLSARTTARAESSRQLTEALIELLGANAAVGFAHGFEDQDRLLDAVSRRSRASATLVLSAPAGVQSELSYVLASSLPIPSRGKTTNTPRSLMYALEESLTSWVREGMPEGTIEARFDATLHEAAQKLKTR